MPLQTAERRFVRRALRYFGIKRVGFTDMAHRDILVVLSQPPVIHLGKRWRAALPSDRQRRIAHELLHVYGYGHNQAMRQRGYYSKPQRDRLSWTVYRDIVAGTRRFMPQRFGLAAAS